MVERFGGEVELDVSVEGGAFTGGLGSEDDVLGGDGVVADPGGNAAGIDGVFEWVDGADGSVGFDGEVEAGDGAGGDAGEEGSELGFNGFGVEDVFENSIVVG